MRQRPKKQEGAPDGGPTDIGAMLAANGGIPLLPPMLEPRRQAQLLYWCRWRLCDIAMALQLPEGTIAAWKSRDKWDDSTPLMRCEGALEAQFVQLVLKQGKGGGDLKEIDNLARQMERFARIRRYQEPGGHEGDLNPKVGARNAAPKKAPKRNQLTGEHLALLEADFQECLFGYQRTWLAAGETQRTRVILKSRQIGATWYFAREALLDALKTGRNQIFLSASKSQAHVFRQYIVEWVKMVCQVELTGEPITIDRGDGLEQPTLYFLGTNARTAQGYHGNFVFDEFFWTFGFAQLNKVASGMAMHKKWRKTYLSTPSSVNHEAYPFWTGDAWNSRRPKADKREFDTSWSATKDGLVFPDRVWRHTVTIEDAERSGCDLFDMEELRLEYSPADFDNLLMCGFVDDTLSTFPMRMLETCLVDELEAWNDVVWWKQQLRGGRPFGDKEVWLSYDPNGDGENADAAGLVIVAPPQTKGGKFRVLYREQFRGSDFTAQDARIKALAKQYNVTKIDIDATGIGKAVHQLVKTWFPHARAHRYDPDVKTRMVLKTLDVISKGRLEYPAGWRDITTAMMSIRKTMTAGGRQSTYVASRTKNSHADLAWALMQALDNEPLEYASANVRRSSVEIYTDD